LAHVVGGRERRGDGEREGARAHARTRGRGREGGDREIERRGVWWLSRHPAGVRRIRCRLEEGMRGGGGRETERARARERERKRRGRVPCSRRVTLERERPPSAASPVAAPAINGRIHSNVNNGSNDKPEVDQAKLLSGQR
jgi:hypothetical protein